MSNSVPEGWAEFRQGDVANFSNGRAYKLDEWESHGTPVIRLQNLTGSGKDYYYSNLNLPDRQYCEYGDLLYMWSATFGPHIWKGPKAIYHYHIWKVTPDEVNFTKAYAYQLLGYKTSEWLNTSNGMGILHVTKGGMEDLPLTLPPLPEQQKIATILSSVDDVIEKTRAQINKLKDLKTGMMQELLTKGIGSGGVPHTEFKDSPVGRIPVGWELFTLKSLCTRITDGTHQAVKTVEDGEIPFLYVSCIRDGKIHWDKAATLTEDAYKTASQGRIAKPNDVLYTAVGSYGHAALVQMDRRFSFQRHIAFIQPDATSIDSYYLVEVLNSTVGRLQADHFAIGNAQLTVTLGDLGKYLIPLPSLNEQMKIASVCKSISADLSSYQIKLEVFQNLKKALMQDLLTGKVRVNVTTAQRESVVA